LPVLAHKDIESLIYIPATRQNNGMWSSYFVTAELGARLSDTTVLPERHIYGRIYCV